jgi:hypothetical protein
VPQISTEMVNVSVICSSNTTHGSRVIYCIFPVLGFGNGKEAERAKRNHPTIRLLISTFRKSIKNRQDKTGITI